MGSRIKKGTQGSEQPLSLHKKEKVCLIWTKKKKAKKAQISQCFDIWQ